MIASPAVRALAVFSALAVATSVTPAADRIGFRDPSSARGWKHGVWPGCTGTA